MAPVVSPLRRPADGDSRDSAIALLHPADLRPKSWSSYLACIVPHVTMGLGTPLLAAKFVSDTLCGGPDPLLGSEAACRSWVHTHQLEAWDRSGVLRSADMIPAIGWFLNLVLVVTMRERYTNFARCGCSTRVRVHETVGITYGRHGPGISRGQWCHVSVGV
eukprot:43733-Chlamydomonas_euryale.AAC.3